MVEIIGFVGVVGVIGLAATLFSIFFPGKPLETTANIFSQNSANQMVRIYARLLQIAAIRFNELQPEKLPEKEAVEKYTTEWLNELMNEIEGKK